MLHAALLLTALSKADVAFIVIGGMAAVAQGATYVTADLDLCYQRHPQNYQRLSQALHPFNPRLRGAPADLPFVLDAATLRAGLNFTLMTEVRPAGYAFSSSSPGSSRRLSMLLCCTTRAAYRNCPASLAGCIVCACLVATVTGRGLPLRCTSQSVPGCCQPVLHRLWV